MTLLQDINIHIDMIGQAVKGKGNSKAMPRRFPLLAKNIQWQRPECICSAKNIEGA